MKIIPFVIGHSTRRKLGWSQPPSWNLLDEDFENISDWTFTYAGTKLYEENPSGQLHLKAGNTVPSNVAGYRYITTSQSEVTIETKVYFDQLANYNGDHHGIVYGHKNGTYKWRLEIFKDQVQYRNSSGWTKMADDVINTGVWYTYRFLLDTPNHTLSVYRDGSFVGQGTDPYADATLNGHIDILCINNLDVPDETEAHFEYHKAASGLYIP